MLYPRLVPGPPTSASHGEKVREGLVAIFMCRDVCTHKVDLYSTHGTYMPTL